jgi:hypothetical protein
VGLGGGAVTTNTAVGATALNVNTTGADAVAIGNRALVANTTGIRNIAIGSRAGQANIGGGNSIFIGYRAGATNTSGNANIAIGGSFSNLGALESNISGSSNVAVGEGALASNTTSNNGTATGYQAGFLSTGAGNQFFGYNSGSAVTTGAKNVILGSYTGSAAPISATGSNNIVLSDGDGNVRQVIDSSGNLLVGTTASGGQNGFAVLKGAGGIETSIEIAHNFGTASGVKYANFLYATGSIGSITQSGTTAVLYNLTSDQRLKENIQDAAPASALIDAIQVRQFDWKSDGSHQRYGFIAQELVTVAPEAVYTPTDPDEMMAVDYSKLVPMLVKELQSLRARVTQLESNP